MPKPKQAKPRIHLVDHPALQHLLTEARDRHTRPDRIRFLFAQIGEMLTYEATRDLPLKPAVIETPLEKSTQARLAAPVTLVPILRAGLGMVEGALRLLPDAHVGHIGMFRDEHRLSPVSYYDKLPLNAAAGPAILLDPMLATGGSALAAIGLLQGRGCRDIRMVCIVASPEGLERVTGEHPSIPIYAAAIDRELDDRGYILPGLGDAGDRLFGTTDTADGEK